MQEQCVRYRTNQSRNAAYYQADRQKGYRLVAFQQTDVDPESLLRTPQDSAERSANLLKQLLFNGGGVSIEAFCRTMFCKR